MQSKSDEIKKNGSNENCWHTIIKFLIENPYYDMFFFVVSFVGLTLPLVRIPYAIEPPRTIDNGILNSLQNITPNHTNKIIIYKKIKLHKDMKYVLVWTKSLRSPVNTIAVGQALFLRSNCSVNKCYVTRNKKLFRNNITRFDALVFIGQDVNTSNVPDVRSSHQKYIYFNMESADNFPACTSQYDGLFNWTTTYKLDSDIPYPYILIRDKNGTIVGPKKNMQWKKDMAPVGDEFSDKIVNKTKAAAWFVSNCASRGRLHFIRELKYALLPYGLTVDVYGQCGSLKCPKENQSVCNKMLERDYFFYMAMENTFAEDYVTEKLLRALRHNVVPIVYGGADYSRFLPPGSYINARKQSAVQLAAMMNKLINSPKQYLQYFRWKNYYTYHSPTTTENVCALCEALHDKEKLQKSTTYNTFRSWWNPNYKKRCLRKRKYAKITRRNSSRHIYLKSNKTRRKTKAYR